MRIHVNDAIRSLTDWEVRPWSNQHNTRAWRNVRVSVGTVCRTMQQQRIADVAAVVTTSVQEVWYVNAQTPDLAVGHPASVHGVPALMGIPGGRLFPRFHSSNCNVFSDDDSRSIERATARVAPYC